MGKGYNSSQKHCMSSLAPTWAPRDVSLLSRSENPGRRIWHLYSGITKLDKYDSYCYDVIFCLGGSIPPGRRAVNVNKRGSGQLSAFSLDAEEIFSASGKAVISQGADPLHWWRKNDKIWIEKVLTGDGYTPSERTENRLNFPGRRRFFHVLFLDCYDAEQYNDEQSKKIIPCHNIAPFQGWGFNRQPLCQHLSA